MPPTSVIRTRKCPELNGKARFTPRVALAKSVVREVGNDLPGVGNEPVVGSPPKETRSGIVFLGFFLSQFSFPARKLPSTQTKLDEKIKDAKENLGDIERLGRETELTPEETPSTLQQQLWRVF